MAWFRGLLLIAVGAAAAVAVDRLVLPADEAGPAPPPPVSDSEPGPGDPPVVWLDGTVEGLDPSEIVLREGRGPRIRIERFAAGATRFLQLDGDRWRELSEEDAAAVSAGGQACVETLLDGRTFLAIRVFLGADCGPA